ncbi:MAG: hypothetical protein Greene041662_483 [Candidatus Peregrinibacteria bacterium Greene0416_62]|nr:MAG: hypothetical protein Greene041662_483 [Candidatus Peregrinibacteria bacterium Greene0416_62]TSC97798.1 MAG: hypothetical protein Greene101449_1093 [Candidatus Peregrinibacteria bacterium Greene1014_49]
MIRVHVVLERNIRNAMATLKNLMESTLSSSKGAGVERSLRSAMGGECQKIQDARYKQDTKAKS